MTVQGYLVNYDPSNGLYGRVCPYDHLTNKRITSPTTRLTKCPPKVILLSCKPCSPDSGGWLGHGVELIHWRIDWTQSFGKHQSIDSNDLIWFDWIYLNDSLFGGLFHLSWCDLIDCFSDGLFDWWLYLIWFDLIWFDLIWFDWLTDWWMDGLIDWLIVIALLT